MIYSMGEMLIDFMEQSDVFVPYPGGAPANVAVHAKRAGSDATFVGKLSNDSFGSLLKRTLDADGIRFPLEDSLKPTALAIVSHDKGERSFQFYRTNTADLDLSIEDVTSIPFKQNDILHLCSLGLVPDGTTFDAHLKAIERCQSEGGIVSFDVNLRERLWDDLELARERVMHVIEKADIVKVNEEELYWLSGTEVIEEGMKHLKTHHQLILCTLGKAGSCALKSDGTYLSVEGLPVNQVDSTGAGDSFSAMMLHSLEQSQTTFLDWQSRYLETALNHATKVSSQVVSHHGATPNIQY